MSLLREIVLAGRVANAAGPPSTPVAQARQPPQGNVNGKQLAQWLSVQAGNMAGDLQHNVRALMLRASSPMPVANRRDEVARLRNNCGIHNKLIVRCRRGCAMLCQPGCHLQECSGAPRSAF